MCTFIEKPAGGGQADAGSGAGDEYGFIRETAHRISLMFDNDDITAMRTRLFSSCRQAQVFRSCALSGSHG